MVNKDVADVRLVCLQHQGAILTEDLKRPCDLDLFRRTEQQLKKIEEMITFLKKEV